MTASRALGRVIPGARLVAILATAALLAACGFLTASIDRDLGVRGFSEDGSQIYPGERVNCEATGRCDDLLAEVDRWIEANVGPHARAASVTLHSAIDDAGQHVLLARSGGGTWVAVVTFADGDRTSLVVGCGVGIDPEPCFAQR